LAAEGEVISATGLVQQFKERLYDIMAKMSQVGEKWI